MKQLFFCCWCVLSGRFNNNNNNIKHLSSYIYLLFFRFYTKNQVVVDNMGIPSQASAQKKMKEKKNYVCLKNLYIEGILVCLFEIFLTDDFFCVCYYELRMSNTVSRLFFFVKIRHKKLCKWIENHSNIILKKLDAVSIRFIVRLIVIWSCTR